MLLKIGRIMGWDCAVRCVLLRPIWWLPRKVHNFIRWSLGVVLVAAKDGDGTIIDLRFVRADEIDF